MKPIKLITAVILMAALFTACKKDSKDSIINQSGSVVHSSVVPARITQDQPQLSFQITTLPSGLNSALQLNAGYLTAGAISLNAFLVNDGIFKESFATKVLKTVDLFSPSVIGYLPVTPGRYNDLTFTLNLI